MQNFNRQRKSPDDPFLAIALFVLGIFGFLTFKAIRALLKPNTRDYRPAAYDRPHSKRFTTGIAAALDAPRVLSILVFVLILLIGALLLPSALVGTIQGARLFAFAALILLSFLGVMLSLLTSQRIVPFSLG